jgi:hypothetical protein
MDNRFRTRSILQADAPVNELRGRAAILNVADLLTHFH